MNNNFIEYTEKAEILKLLAHPVRLCIVKGLLEIDSCNVSYMQECLQIPQSTISQHIQKLKLGRIVEGTRNGVEINYQVCNETVIKLITALF